MAIRRDCDFLMCFGSLSNISRIKFFFKGSYGSGNSIGHSGGKYRNETFHCLRVWKNILDSISDTPESSGATNGKSQLYQQASA